MQNIDDSIKKLKENAEKELEYCNEGDTPTVCGLISTPRGKELVIDLIVEYVGKRAMTISESITAIERENNIQLSEVQ